MSNLKSVLKKNTYISYSHIKMYVMNKCLLIYSTVFKNINIIRYVGDSMMIYNKNICCIINFCTVHHIVIFISVIIQ